MSFKYEIGDKLVVSSPHPIYDVGTLVKVVRRFADYEFYYGIAKLDEIDDICFRAYENELSPYTPAIEFTKQELELIYSLCCYVAVNDQAYNILDKVQGVVNPSDGEWSGGVSFYKDKSYSGNGKLIKNNVIIKIEGGE